MKQNTNFMKSFPVKFFFAFFSYLFFLCFFFEGQPSLSYASSLKQKLPLIDEYIREVKTNSLQIKSSLQSKKALLTANQTERLLFDYKMSLNSEWKFYPKNEEENPMNSLFFPPSHFLSRSNINTYSFTHSKLWSKGFNTSFEAQFLDSKRQSLFNLALAFKTDLFRNLFSRRLSRIEAKIQEREKLILIQSKKEIKAIVIQALFELTEILEIQNAISLQKQFCQTISNQSKKFKEKRKKRSISKRELLQSVKELTTCVVHKKNLLKQSFEKKEKLKARYGINTKKPFSLKVDPVFKGFYQVFRERSEFQIKDLSLEENDEILSLKSELKTLKIQAQNSKALTGLGLSFELKGGLSSDHNTRLFPLKESLFSSPDPYILAKIKLELPIKNKEALLKYIQEKHQIEALEHQITFLERNKKSQFHSLKQTLKKDFSMYKDLKTKASLSKDILSEANKDFENGRIDFYILSNFQKDLIQIEKDLSEMRLRILIRLIEYLNELNFFDPYLVSSSNTKTPYESP